MKKAFGFMGLSVAAAVLILHGLVNASGETLSIFNYDGRVLVIRNGRTVQVELDMPCREKDILKVEAESWLDITMNKLVGVRFLADSECVIVNTNSGDMALKLNSGGAILNLKDLSEEDAAFRLETPAATAHANPGAQLQFWCKIEKTADGNSTTTFSVKKGSITVGSDESPGAVSVLEGQSITVPVGSFLPSTRNATEEEQDAVRRASALYIPE